MFSTSCWSFEVSDVCIESRRPPVGTLVSSKASERGGDIETGDAELEGSGVVATDGIALLGASVIGLALGLREQFWGRSTPSVFSIFDASVSRLECGETETGEKWASLPLWLGDKDRHSKGAGW